VRETSLAALPGAPRDDAPVDTEKRVIGTRAAIAIPAYNAETTIGETLDGLQANPGLSRVALVALLDDCSTDRTAEVARAHWRSPVPLEVWQNAENIGQWRTTNALMARVADRVEPEWTFILHADDVPKPNWLSLYLEELPRVPASVGTVCSSYDYWWPASGRIEAGEEFPDRPAVHVAGDRASVIGTLEKGGWWHLSGCAVRNAAFQQIGGFLPELPHVGDWEWILRCLAKGHGIWYLPRSTALYRQHEQSVSSRSFREGADFKEKLKVLAIMRSLGYLGQHEHDGRVRVLVRQLVRRTLVRGVRGDWYGFRGHSAVLREAVLGRVLRRP
jgi:GT2 family glycosyltransferase